MTPPRAMVAGSVTNHDAMILPATPQRTADLFLALPAPMIAQVMTWVVETGAPRGSRTRSR